MRRNTTLEVLVLALFAISTTFAQQSQKLGVTASIWNYKSLCEFQDPDSKTFSFRLPMSITSTTVTGCMDIEQEYGHATAIRLLVKNVGTSDETIQFESLKAVILHLAGGRTLTPIAIRWPWKSPYDGRLNFEFYTGLSGNWHIEVPAGAEINLVFLFKEAPNGATVQIGSMTPVTIR
jgi:hypothetical protein